MPVANILTYVPWVNAYWSEDPTSGLPGNGAAVATWDDKGSRSLDLAQATAGAKPTMRTSVAAVNNRPAVEFDGTSDTMVSAAGSTVSQPYTQVLICNIRSLPAGGAIAALAPIAVASATRGIGINGTGPAWRYEVGANASGGTATSGPHVMFGFASGTSSALTVDFTTTAFNAAGNTSGVNTLYLGARNAAVEFAAIDVVFYGLIDRALTATEKADIQIWATLNYATPGAVMQAPLGALTGSATATPTVLATMAAPLGSLTGSTTATPDHPATLAAPLGALSATASAILDHPAALSAPLGGLAGAMAAGVEHPATLDAPLGAVVGSMAATVTPGSVTVNATMDAPLGALTAMATATPEVAAVLAAPLGALSAAVTATVDHTATLSAPLGSLTAALTADVEDTAVMSAPLGGLAASASAQVTVQAQAGAILGALTAALSASVEHAATLAAPLGSLNGTASAIVAQYAVLAALLGGLDAHITASVVHAPKRFVHTSSREPSNQASSQEPDRVASSRRPVAAISTQEAGQ